MNYKHKQASSKQTSA